MTSRRGAAQTALVRGHDSMQLAVELQAGMRLQVRLRPGQWRAGDEKRTGAVCVMCNLRSELRGITMRAHQQIKQVVHS